MTSERERFAVMHQFGRTYRAFMAAFEAHVGQPMPRWRILLALHDNTGGGMAQKQLAERLQMDPGALTRQLKVLEQLGWIERTTDARDNRLTNVSLSDAGLAIVLECMPRRIASINATLDGLPEHHERLFQYLGLGGGLTRSRRTAYQPEELQVG